MRPNLPRSRPGALPLPAIGARARKLPGAGALGLNAVGAYWGAVSLGYTVTGRPSSMEPAQAHQQDLVADRKTCRSVDSAEERPLWPCTCYSTGTLLQLSQGSSSLGLPVAPRPLVQRFDNPGYKT